MMTMVHSGQEAVIPTPLWVSPAAQWRTMGSAPKDQVIIAMARYKDASVGSPAFVHYRSGEWRHLGRTLMEPLICWAWMPREVLGRWPDETGLITAGYEPKANEPKGPDQ